MRCVRQDINIQAGVSAMTSSVIEKKREAAAFTAASLAVSQLPEIKASTEPADPEWDAYVAATPGGHHVQTSTWSRLKATLGWCTRRLIAREGGRIVGGAQILTRRFSPLLNVAYVPKGPIYSAAGDRAATAFVAALRDEIRAQKLSCVILQPPDETPLTAALREHNFRPMRLATLVQATTVIDLTLGLDDILMGMKPKARNRLRHGLKSGLQARRGNEEDLNTFYDLLMSTAGRQGFQDYEKSYFQQLWRLFAPGGHAQLFFVEYEGKPVSAIFCLAFGDTAICKKRGWSGEFGNLRPNEVAEWEVIQWAKEAGYRYYDFEGIQLRAAESVLRGEPLAEQSVEPDTNYKLKFGGDVRIFPEPLVYFSNPLIRWGHRVVYPAIADWPIIYRIAAQIKVN
jgi:lipid II:glycine glycyltransferase (peptidoglycan interpeptide bridge formation enzyme)